MVKTLFLIIGITLLLVPMTTFLNSGTANADGPFEYPGPFGPYEEDEVTIACVQMGPVWGSTPATLEKMKGYLIQAAEKGADIIVFPEKVLNSCDRANNPDCTHKDVAEPLPGPSSLEIAELTRKYGVYAIYGFLEQDESDSSKIYNTAAIIGPEGIIGGYQKIHPGFPEKVERGRQPVAFDTPWGPVGVGICYDNYGNPELARTYALMGCRILINPTSLYKAANMTDQTITMLSSRAGENFLFIATANKVGRDSSGDLPQSGKSTIIGPKGISYTPTFYAGPASEDDEELLIATLDLKDSDTIRNLACTFNVYPDWGEPSFLPQMWADLWGTADEELAEANEQLESVNNQLETLQQDYEKSLETTSQTITILGIVAAVLLLATIAFGVLAFRKRKP